MSERRRKLRILIVCIVLALVLRPLYRALSSICYVVYETSTLEDAAIWMEENVPPGSRIAMEAHCPRARRGRYVYTLSDVLGENGEKPGGLASDGVEFVVTSSKAHGKLVKSPGRHPAVAAFHRELQEEWPLVKSFRLTGPPWKNPVIRIYGLAGRGAGAAGSSLPRIPLPGAREAKRYEHTYINNMRFGKDLLLIRMKEEKKMSRLAVFEDKPREAVFFCLWASKESPVRVSAGPGTARMLASYPGVPTYTKVRVRPSFFSPGCYRVRFSAQVDKWANCLLKVAVQPAEIARTFLDIGELSEALTYLRLAVEEDPGDYSSRLLLAGLLAKVGDAGQAGEIFARLDEEAPWYTGLPDGAGRERKEARVLRERAAFQSRLAMRYFQSERTFGGWFIHSERRSYVLSHSSEGKEENVFLYGPYWSVEPGPYRAVFRFRVRGAKRSGPVLKLDITAEKGRRVLAEHVVTREEAGTGEKFLSIALPFESRSWSEKFEFRVRALARCETLIDWIGIEPDVESLRAAQAQASLLAWARAERRAGKHDLALSLLERASDLTRSSEEYRLEFALASGGAGSAGAVEALRQAVGEVPGNRGAWEALALAYEKTGKEDKAARTWETIRERWEPAEALGPGEELVFGEQLRLYGYELVTPRMGPGGEVELKLYLECLAPMQPGLYLFVHFEADGDFFIGDTDIESAGWKSGDARVVTVRAKVPGSSPPGAKTVSAGIWHPVRGTRLALRRGPARVEERKAAIVSLEVVAP